jgi:SAM-dependent methyltransferase
MRDYGRATYGDLIADVYDEWHGALVDDDTPAAVAFLAELANGGRVLELGVGTGRLAIPLAERGLEVVGVDVSAEMLKRLRAKPGAERLHVVHGDAAEVEFEEQFELAFAAYNTFFSLESQDRQVECFEHTARCLRPGGVFVLEVYAEDLTRFVRNQACTVRSVTADSVTIEFCRHDPLEQTLSIQYLWVNEGGFRLQPALLRYAWPSELDLMARIAGLRLRERWGGWSRQPFAVGGARHVSVYQRDS